MVQRQEQKITILHEWFECDHCGRRFYFNCDNDEKYNECWKHEKQCSARDPIEIKKEIK